MTWCSTLSLATLPELAKRDGSSTWRQQPTPSGRRQRLRPSLRRSSRTMRARHTPWALTGLSLQRPVGPGHALAQMLRTARPRWSSSAGTSATHCWRLRRWQGRSAQTGKATSSCIFGRWALRTTAPGVARTALVSFKQTAILLAASSSLVGSLSEPSMPCALGDQASILFQPRYVPGPCPCCGRPIPGPAPFARQARGPAGAGSRFVVTMRCAEPWCMLLHSGRG
mmetsp:Transcript_17744/g.45734  ORF Transcript_17744/g.45734 Transcript_17744/m.45734 type:complete len:226 (+) Transcript_17744:939-1616(+)